jgi:hypothetical protein
MEQFKAELKVLLSRYPQVKSVSFDVTETITANTQTTVAPPLGKPVFQASSPTAAVEAVIATMKK